MSGLEASGKGRKRLTYIPVTVQVPSRLLDEFDRVCSELGYTRSEAIRELMRRFILEHKC